MSGKATRKRPFQWRALVALLLFGAGFLLMISGIVLYLAPSGRVAKSIEWRLLGLDKDQWEALHTAFGIVFLVLFGFHLKYNWRSILAYARKKLAGALRLRTELVWATVLTLTLTLIAIFDLPPMRQVMALGEGMTDYWERWGEAHGYYVTSEEEAHEETNETGGKGWGKLTVEALAEEKGVSLEDALAQLAAAGIEARPEDNLLTLSGKSGISPSELAALVGPETP